MADLSVDTGEDEGEGPGGLPGFLLGGSVGRGGCALGGESSGTGSAALVALKNAWMGTSAPPGQRSRQTSWRLNEPEGLALLREAFVAHTRCSMDSIAGTSLRTILSLMALSACADAAAIREPAAMADAAAGADASPPDAGAGADIPPPPPPGKQGGPDSGFVAEPSLTDAAAAPDGGSPSPTPSCDAGPIRWVTEGETLEIQVEVRCSADERVRPERVQFVALPPGASYDPRTAQLSWTPDLDQAAVHDLYFEVTEIDEAGWLRIGVADAFDHPDNIPIVDPLRYPLEYGLPVFFLRDPDHESYHPSSLIYTGRRYPNIEVKLRGQTSRDYPKNSYTLKFPNHDRFKEPEHGGGLTDRRKLVLTTTFDDNTYLRQRLAHEMWGLLDPRHISVKSYNAVVYRDGEYRGVYTVSDHIDRHLMGNHGLSIDGELFKSRTHAGSFLNAVHDMEKTEGYPEHGSPGWDDSLQALISFVRDSSAAEYRDGLDDYITVADYQNWWVFTTFVAASDSAGKNAYHYRESEQATFRVVPWDFNASFGQDWRTLRDSGQNKHLGRNGIWARMAADEAAREAMLTRAQEALEGPYALAGILSRFDQYYAEIEAAIERDWHYYQDAYRSFPRWAELREDFTTPSEEAAYVRQWITEHWAFLADHLPQLLSTE